MSSAPRAANARNALLDQKVASARIEGRKPRPAKRQDVGNLQSYDQDFQWGDDGFL